MKYESVIFDMDGVIVDSMPWHYEAWHKAFLSEKIDVSRLEIYKREGERGQVTVRDILNRNRIRPTQNRIKALLSLKEQIFKKIADLQLFDGAEELVRLLNDGGTKLGIVTGTSRGEVNRLLPSGFRALFDVIITGNEVSRGKPDPEPYLLALKKLDSDKDKTIVVENAPYGIRSAKSAGLVCIALKTSLPASYLGDADHVLDSVSHVRDFVMTT